MQGRITTANGSAWQAWQAEAGREIASAGFARLHAEAMSLLGSVAESVQGLPGNQRDRYAGYLPHWWAALVRPRDDWATVKKGIIEEQHLHMLAALADVLEGRAEAISPRDPQIVDRLRRTVDHLLGEIDAMSDLHAPVRAQIMADLRHIAWLLANADTFGVDRAVEAMERTAGKVVVEATKTGSWSLKKVAVMMVAALSMTAAGTGSVAQIAADVRSTFGIETVSGPDGKQTDKVEQTVVEVYNVCTVPQLESGPATSDGEPVDAEIVGDEPAP